MHIFVTGATGWVGSAVVRDLIDAGHTVLGMTRSEAGAAALTAAGAAVHHGTLEDLDSLRGGAAGADAVVHTAFNHDFSQFAANCALDQRAIAALGAALEGSTRPLLVTSGVAHLAAGRSATEAAAPPPNTAAYPRASEAALAAVRARGVRGATVRLPPSVHGDGDHGFIPMLIAVARAQGASAYVGDGQNRWPAVHRDDAARVYRLALEHGVDATVYHAIAEEGVAFRDIAEVIGRRLNLPVVSKTPAQAADHFGWFAAFVGADAPSSSAQTRASLGWEPRGPGLVADIDQPGYFAV